MDMSSNFGFGLSALPFVQRAETRVINPENPEGRKGSAGQAAGKLGAGRKGKACINIAHGETVTLAEMEGPGVVQHLWMTVQDKTENCAFVLRNLVLRMYWDDEAEPSVEAPVGDFFCNGFSAKCKVFSLPIVVAPYGGFNSYFPLPFRKKARITITNEHPDDIHSFFYTVNYCLTGELPDEVAYFHAQWRRERITTLKKDYTIVDGIRGRGQYVGTYLAWTALERYWWGEGEIKGYIDGDEEYPTYCGTGVEDYFGGAWGFHEQDELGHQRPTETTYNSPFLGYPFYSKTDLTRPEAFGYDALPMHGLYRWHIMDPIHFERDLRLTIQQIGCDGDKIYERSDDVASTAYWYQIEPHAAFPVFPGALERWPR